MSLSDEMPGFEEFMDFLEKFGDEHGTEPIEKYAAIFLIELANLRGSAKSRYQLEIGIVEVVPATKQQKNNRTSKRSR